MHSHFVVGVVLGVFFAAGMCGTAISAILPPQIREWFGYGALVLGVVVTVAAMLMNALPLYVSGSAIAGLGFGAAFRFVVNALAETAPIAQREEVFATMYIASYVAFSVPALAAGLAVGRFGLEPTAVVYGALDIALVLIATIAGPIQTRRRAKENELRPAQVTGSEN